MSNKRPFPNFEAYEKKCTKCHRARHITKFRRHKKVSKICNECFELTKNKICVECKEERYYTLFLRNGTHNHEICNPCVEKMQEIIDEGFDLAFSVLDKGRTDVHTDK